MPRKLDFKISTGLKNIIGKELITQPHTAVFELVKNAYDAEASRVDIVFQNVKDPDESGHGKLLIVDDGDGMSYEDIRNKWLFVGYSEKKEQGKDNTNFRERAASKNRVMAGAKGIGRFSADRLGGKLNLYTKTRSGSSVHHVTVDWRRFENNQDEEFQKVRVEYEEIVGFPDLGARKLLHGTILEIFPLADGWDKAEIVKLRKYLQRLVNPMQIGEGEDFEIHMAADEFLESEKDLKGGDKEHEIINGKVPNVVFEKIGIKTTQITCRIAGSKITTRITDKGRFVFETEERNDIDGLRDVNINVFYLNPEAKKAFTRIMGMRSVNFGSVFLYKNGFRIHPYGEEKDDWLNLERRKGQGRTRYLSTRELIGRVEINRSQPGFSEVSSRGGGVVETKEYRHLLKFMQARVIRWLERYVVEGLDWDRSEGKAKKTEEELTENSIGVLAKFTNQIKDPDKRVKFNPDLTDILKEKQASDLPEVMKNLRVMASFAESDNAKARIKRYLKRLEVMARERTNAAAAATKALKAMEKENLFLKSTQSKNMVFVRDYNHWVGIATGDIQGHLIELVNRIRANRNAEDLLEVVEMISMQNQRIDTVLSIIDRSNFNVRTEAKKDDIVAYITQYVRTMVAGWEDETIDFTIYGDDAVFDVKFTPLEISIMVDNFVSNSRKAGASNVFIKFLVNDRKLHVFVSDDGRGIPAKDKDLVFKRGFSTTPGSGIGLGHIQTIAQEMGSVRFIGNGKSGLNSGACFEVIINASE